MKCIKIVRNKTTDKWLNFCSALAQAHLGCLILIKSNLDTNTLMYKQCVIHESIHIAQSRELLVIFWYVIYVSSFLKNYIPEIIKVILSKEMTLKADGSRIFWNAYRDIIFEKESFLFEADDEYISKRKMFSCFRLI